MNIKTVSVMNRFGKPVAEIREYISRDVLRGTVTKNRVFKPLNDHFLKADGIHLYHTKNLKTGEKSLLAYMGEAVDGHCVANGFENVKKLVASIKSGIRVNPYSKEWCKQVFGK